ncbi:bis-aminopropyl spermidine synthase family protein [Dactylosporangium matsuzakiense]|uniref:Methyltransferase n=1 Tax=Dactylosporangium matsuzakiense TaxID=53360 RepID=A0A9W6KNL1_9ACTN|nr:bis-aminopropyl spermidine synthase family protein [Dactylosporangium matsuzakiense]GLL03859.1 methyltransferase [Dactylosporangium matsuzakiense]
MEPGGIDAVAAVVSASGIAGRRLREVIAVLAAGPTTLDDLVRDHAVPRRSVEALLRAAGPDVREERGKIFLNPLISPVYSDRLALHRLPDEPRVDGMAALIAAAPAPDQALDHVAATAETAERRARWLATTYDLAGARVVCIGDHDLTSLALRRACPDTEVTVVDVDERLLAYIDGQGAGIACYQADLRFGLPPAVAGSADLIFTDPPYTPEGVQLFLGRGAQALRDRVNGRLVMAYGFSPLTPALGLKVQRAVLDLDLVIEAMLPAFNRYHGAQAVGSASDLYVCRPTQHTWQILDRRLDRLAGSANIYTHGEQSLEGAAARGPARILGGGPLRADELTVDLAGDPGAWLARVLLAVNAAKVTLLVPNQHPDLRDEAGQTALRKLIGAKYDLRLRRSTPGPKQATVEATLRPAGEDGVAGWLLTHAHGKLGNVLREALVRTGLPRAAAAARAAELIGRPEYLDARLLDVPRHVIVPLLHR